MLEQKPGTFDATVVDYGASTTKKGSPMVMIRFKYEDGDKDAHFINWYGTFASDKSSEITCEALAVCGWTTNSPADLAKGAGSGVLDETRQVSITLKNDEYEGKVRLKVAYINPPGGAGFRDSMGHAEAVKAFSGINIGAIAAQARKKHGTKPVPNLAPTFDPEEKVPF